MRFYSSRLHQHHAFASCPLLLLPGPSCRTLPVTAPPLRCARMSSSVDLPGAGGQHRGVGALPLKDVQQTHESAHVPGCSAAYGCLLLNGNACRSRCRVLDMGLPKRMSHEVQHSIAR